MAFLVLFAVRAVAGPALCEMLGEHRVPHGAAHAVTAHADSSREIRGTQDDHRHARLGHPSHDKSDHDCEEPVYLTGDRASLPTLDQSLSVASIAWSPAPRHDWKSAVVPKVVPPPPLAHPPPSRDPLDISARLRI